jgi:DnaJ-class molecular chaperone
MSLANDPDNLSRECPQCGGRGELEYQVHFASADAYRCPTCEGEGHVSERIATVFNRYNLRYTREGRDDG